MTNNQTIVSARTQPRDDLHRIITTYYTNPQPPNLQDMNTLIYAAEQHYLDRYEPTPRPFTLKQVILDTSVHSRTSNPSGLSRVCGQVLL